MVVRKLIWAVSVILLLGVVVVAQCCWMGVPLSNDQWQLTSRGRLLVLDNEPLRAREAVARSEQFESKLTQLRRVKTAHLDPDDRKRALDAVFNLSRARGVLTRPTTPRTEVATDGLIVIAAFAVVPLVGLIAMARRARLMAVRRRDGLCMVCGFDLRASPIRCPECGAVPIEVDRLFRSLQHAETHQA